MAISRDSHGIAQIKCNEFNDFSYELGKAHGEDRLVQMILLRTIGRGQICELLEDSEDNLKIDIFMRDLGLSDQLDHDLKNLDPKAKAFCQSYCNGVNEILKNKTRPLEFFLVGLRPQNWTIQDSLLTIRIMSYLGLAQGQADLEKCIIQSIASGVDVQKLKELFSPHLNELEDDLVLKLKNLKYIAPFYPHKLMKKFSLPCLKASNNWVVNQKLSKNNKTLFCFDPHLECNRLPAIWYEVNAKVAGLSLHGISMPGVPGLAMGRKKDWAFSFTYGFMDMVDYFVEEIKDSQFQYEGIFRDLQKTSYEIKRKKNPDFQMLKLRTENGTLEFNPFTKIEDGLFLSRSWSGEKGAASSMNVLYNILEEESFSKASELFSQVSISCNWLLANDKGEMKMRQSGICPIRSGSGLAPLDGSLPQNSWSGYYAHSELSRLDNNESFLATSNNDVQVSGCAHSINISMGDYRQRRIEQLIKARSDHDIDSMKAIQSDLFSLQAKEILEVLTPFLPQHPYTDMLNSWDYRYTMDSKACFLFEKLYEDLMSKLYSEIFPSPYWDHIVKESSVFADYYQVFDRVILSNEFDHWYEDKIKIMKNRITKTFNDTKELKTWGDVHHIKMENIFFAGKLPSFLGFDLGPFPIPGGRCTVSQANLYRAHDRQTSFLPSFRFVTELGESSAYTCLTGGVSGSRFSPLYKSEIKNWLEFKYKKIDLL